MSFMTSTRGVGRENDLFMSLNFRSAVFFLIWRLELCNLEWHFFFFVVMILLFAAYFI